MKTTAKAYRYGICCATLFLLQSCALMPSSDSATPLVSQAKVVTRVLQEKAREPNLPVQGKKTRPEKISAQENVAPPEPGDANCAYFYFLWGTQAEYGKRYTEALDAYQKALVCDPSSSYVQQKIPSLMFHLKQYDDAENWLKKTLALSPHNPFYLQLLAGTYLQQKKIEEGLKVYSRLLELQPDNDNTVSRLAIIYLQQKNSRKAISLLEEFLQNHQKAYSPRLTLARIYSQHKDFASAVTAFEQVQAIHWTEEVAEELAYCYRQTGELEKAENLYRKMMEDGSYYEDPAFMLIKLFLEKKRYQEALDELNKLRKISQDTARVDYSRSQILLRQHRQKEAQTLLRSLIDTPAHNDACYLLAILAYQDEDFDTSLNYLKSIERNSEKFQQSVYLQAHIYEHRQAYSQAIDTLCTALPETADRTPLFYAVLSSLLQSQKKSQEAKDILHKGLASYPDSAELLYELGLLYENEGKRQLALTTMEKLIIKQPNHADALNFLGYSWADSNINLNQAYRYIRKANTLKPDNAFILDSLGWVLYRMGKFHQANEILEKALVLVPDSLLILEHLGDVNIALKRHESARKYYNQAYQQAGDKTEQKRIGKKLEELKETAKSEIHDPPPVEAAR